MKRVPIALTIAGSDSSGGAGIQADIKSMSANGVYAASVLSVLTAQNTRGVTAIHDVPPEFISAQIDAVFSDLRVDAVKIGMLSRPQSIVAVADGLKKWQARNIVLDPVMVAESGDALIADDAVSVLVEKLFPVCALITPNRHEAARLTSSAPAKSDEQVVEQANEISTLARGAAVLLKGGHGEGATSRDLLVSAGDQRWFEAPRVDTRNTHGTGCSLSSAIAANLALGMGLVEAIGSAKSWLTAAIAAADDLEIGSGRGPVHHFHNLWREKK
jgi:hydroxymethylpyrimidine/phosphomethylpyrimidine kinase